MVDDTADSTAEFEEVDREWTNTTLKDPETADVDLSGEVEEAAGEVDTDLADADDIAAKLRSES